MKKVFLFLCIVLCTFCSQKKVSKPRDLYSIEQVANFLKDLYLLESKINELRVGKDSAKIIFDYYEAKLYEKHHMNDSIYRKSFLYYMDDIQGLSRAYEIIADSLSLEERIAIGENEEEE